MKQPIPFAQRMTEDRRLSILLLLDQSPTGTLNEVLLQAALPEFGHDPSSDVIQVDMAWLAEAGLIEHTNLHGLAVGKLLPRGRDAALGRAVVPGVQKPLR